MSTKLKGHTSKVKTSDGKEESKVPAVITPDPISFAVGSVMNTAKLVVTEEGDQRRLFDPSVIASMRGMLGSKTYDFQISRTSTIVSGTGTCTIATSLDLTQFSEGSALIALFDECKLVRGRLDLSLCSIGGGTNNFAWICGIFPSITSALASASAVARLDYCMLTSTAANTVPQSVLKYKFPNRVWGYTVDEGVSSPRIISGCNHTLVGYVAGGTPSNTTTYFAYLIKEHIRLRSRT